jgi:hypothetical protein
VIDLQRLSLWRAAWQHAMVALAAIVVTLVAVRWYVPSVADMQALRTEKSRLAASVADLERRGGKLQISHCGPERRLCVAGDDYADIYGKAGELSDCERILIRIGDGRATYKRWDVTTAVPADLELPRFRGQVSVLVL